MFHVLILKMLYVLLSCQLYKNHVMILALVVKNPPVNVADIRNAGLIPESGRAPGEGNGNPLQYSCLENPWTEEPGWL